MTLRISSIRAISAGEEVQLTFEVSDGEHSSLQSFVISSKQYLVLCPEKGECDTELYEAVEHMAQLWSAVKRGISLLNYGSCSEKALRVKLVSKGVERVIAEEAVCELASMGLLHPFDDAFREAQRMSAKLWGKRRISAGLYEKGYSAEAVAYALDGLDRSGVDYTESCRKLIERKYSDMADGEAERRRAFAALVRYGYGSDEIKQA